MKFDTFLEISFDDFSSLLDADGEIFKLGDIMLESASDKHCCLKMKDIGGIFYHRVELKRCHRDLPVARCNCKKGLENIRCKHLLKALQMYVILDKLGLIARLTEKTGCLWIPYKLQKV